MTRTEILAYLRGNFYHRVTHRLFDSTEYLYCAEDGNIYDENGYLFEDWDEGSFAHNGLRMRTGGPWEDGWGILDKAERGVLPHSNQATFNHNLKIFLRTTNHK